MNRRKRRELQKTTKENEKLKFGVKRLKCTEKKLIKSIRDYKKYIIYMNILYILYIKNILIYLYIYS